MIGSASRQHAGAGQGGQPLRHAHDAPVTMTNRAEAGDDGRALARHHVAAAIEVEVAVMNDATVSASARLAAAEAILNRACGRPPSAPNPVSPHNDFERMLAAAEAILSANGGGGAAGQPVAGCAAAVRY